MSKDPAILFYTSDYLSGTAFFTYEEKGRYMELLCLQHQNGHIPYEVMLKYIGSIDSPIWDKFKIDNSGKYYQQRMEDETIKRKKYSESRRKNIKNRYESTYESTYEGDMKPHMGNGNRNDNILLKKGDCKGETKKTLFYPDMVEVIEYFESMNFPEKEAEDFWNHYESQGWIKANGIPVSKSGWRSTAQIWHKNQIKRNLEEKQNGKSDNGSYQSRLNHKTDISSIDKRVKELKELGFD